MPEYTSIQETDLEHQHTNEKRLGKKSESDNTNSNRKIEERKSRTGSLAEDMDDDIEHVTISVPVDMGDEDTADEGDERGFVDEPYTVKIFFGGRTQTRYVCTR